MGYMRHHAIVVTGLYDHIVQAQIAARAIVACYDSAAPVTELTREAVNSYQSFAMLSDGSKDGWADSNNGDKAREAFISWLREDAYCVWAEVQYGDDDHDNKVLHHNNDDASEEE